ncbi:chorismate mutase [Candidatus Peregrinibacteria bacterium]|nr:chorismate mutase [Candidatus Peregrinibacteria bacterium]
MNEIENIRKNIDLIDNKIASLLEQRLKEIQKIKKIKNNKRIKVINREREKEILSKQDTKFSKRIFKKILKESRKIQERSLT